jgi:DNA-binding MarR family transcriptional regulator
MTSTNHPSPALDELICFALYNASRAITQRYRDLLAPLGLTYPQYLVLLVLWQNGPTGVGALGEHLELDSGTLSPLLRRLETAGHVTRSRSSDDERAVTVSLTPRGSALQAEAAHIPEQICAATGLDLPDLQRLQQQVAGLADSVRANS